ncbi:MAG: T9SS type A sorting domain-containing protein [Flavobacteriales bacterium]|nr:T9SS type A sorting domain-containing protein [Flavobacteriales bacterium]
MNASIPPSTKSWAWLLLVATIGLPCIQATAQCTNGTAYLTVAAPTTPSPVTISICTFQTEYNTVTGIVAGQTYSVGSSCGGYITVRRGTFNGAVVANGNAPLTFTAPVAGTYYLHFNTNAGCGTATNCCTTTITCTSCTVTPPPGACTAVNIPSLPVAGQAVACHASNLITSANVFSICGTASTLYLGGNEALYTVTPTTTGSYAINYGGQTWSSIWVFSGACPAAGGACVGSVSSSTATQSLLVNMTAGVQYWILFDTWPTPASPCPGTFSISNVPPPVVASDCNQAVNVCTNINFQIDPNGFGSVYEIPPLGSLGNPDYGLFSLVPPYYNPWGTANEGCLRAGELNSTWMVVNVLTGGSLTFTFGGLGTQTGYYDWIMYPYNTNACTQVAANQLAPVRCNWNGVSFGGTGLEAPPPAGGNATNFEPPLNVGSQTQWLICFSNWSSVTTAVPLQFGGTAVVSCSPLPMDLMLFDAAVEGRTVELEWLTLSESNSSRFVVERSMDGLDWTDIVMLAAAGTSQQPLLYKAVDGNPLQGTSYYRLRMIDLDGSYQHSLVRSITMKHSSLSIIPNPAQGRFVVHGIGDGAEVRLIDALGRPVPNSVSRVSDSAVEVEPWGVSPGIYTVQIISDGATSSSRVLIDR